MKNKTLFILLIIILLALLGCTREVKERIKPRVSGDEIVQFSTRQNLSDENYKGSFNIDMLGEYGDFGFGILSDPGAEMVLIDNVSYKISDGGNTEIAQPGPSASYFTVKFFQADKSTELHDINSIEDLFEKIKSGIKDTNQFAAIKIDGDFSYLKTQSIKKIDKPSSSENEAAADRTIHQFENIEGTLVGFYIPSLYGNINFTELNFLFISKDRTKGGHLLDCKSGNVKVMYDNAKELKIVL